MKGRCGSKLGYIYSVFVTVVPLSLSDMIIKDEMSVSFQCLMFLWFGWIFIKLDSSFLISSWFASTFAFTEPCFAWLSSNLHLLLGWCSLLWRIFSSYVQLVCITLRHQRAEAVCTGSLYSGMECKPYGMTVTALLFFTKMPNFFSLI